MAITMQKKTMTLKAVNSVTFPAPATVVAFQYIGARRIAVHAQVDDTTPGDDEITYNMAEVGEAKPAGTYKATVYRETGAAVHLYEAP